MRDKAARVPCKEVLDGVSEGVGKVSEIPCRLTVSRIALRFQSIVESYVGDADHEPADKTSDSRDIEEPAENYGGIIADVQVHQRQWKTCQADRVVRHTEPVASLQDLGSMSITAQAKDGA